MCDGGSKGDESLLWVISSMGTAAAQPVCVCVCVCVCFTGGEKNLRCRDVQLIRDLNRFANFRKQKDKYCEICMYYTTY